MTEHPSAAELEGLVRGDLTREQARFVVRHLLRGCERCVAMIAPYASALLDVPIAAASRARSGLALADGDSAGSGAAPAAERGRPARPARSVAPPPSPRERPPAEIDRTLLENAYDRAIDRAFAAVMRHGEKAARIGTQVREMLAELTAEQLESWSELPADLAGYAGYEALLERSWTMRREDPKQMVKLAELASSAAAGLGEEGFSDGQVHDFQARAAVELANAYRVLDRLEEAQASLEAARGHFREGSQDRLLGARLLEVEANVGGDRGELDEALVALDVALRIYRRYGDPHLAGRVLIKKGHYTARAERQQEAIELLTEGLAMIDPAQDGPLVLAAVHNTAFCLMESGRCREARTLLWRHLGLYERHGGRQDRLKLRWLQAQIHDGLGDFARAERTLDEVRLGLRESGKTHGEALATIELAGLNLRQGREEQARGLAVEATNLFLGLDITREAAVELTLLKAGLESSAGVTLERVGQIKQLLRDTAPDEQPSALVRSA